MKRLLVRLSLISALVAAGVFAIAQSQREPTQANSGDTPQAPPLSPQVPPHTPAPVAGEANPATLAGLIPLPAQYDDPQGGAQYVMPAPSAAIMRGNNAEEEPNADEAGSDRLPETAASGQAAQPEDSKSRTPPANLLAQNDATSRPRNPFGRRTEIAAANDEGEFRVGAAAPAAPAPAADLGASPNSDFQQYPAADDAASNASQPAASDENNTENAPTLAAPQTSAPATVAPLGAPREFTPYGDTMADDAAADYGTPRPIGAASPDAANPLPANSAPEYSFSRDPQRSATLSQSAQPSPLDSSPTTGGYRASMGGAEGTGAPGPQNLEGAQTPSITLKKIAPPEIQVGKPATFEIDVRNVGRVAAHQVIVKEEIPRGVQLIDAAPPATPQGGSLLWELGTLQAGESRQIKIQYMPVAEGDIGSVAVAAFQAQASVRTVCTRPQLTIEQSAPEKVLLGQSFTVRIRLANPGTGVANKVVLEEDVPDGFGHPAGKALEYEVGALRPGESRDLDLTLQAARPGVWNNLLVVRGEGNLAVEHGVKIEIVAPQLELAMTGPSRRYLERQATYTVAVANPGTATANDVKLVGRLPKGMKFVAANNEGQYDPKTHVVQWSLAELPPGQVGQVQLTALPVETGEQKIVVEGEGELDIAAQAEHAVAVEALAELAFEIADQADPIEVNKETIYEVKVTNKGSKTATNIRVIAVFPPDMKPLAGDGPARAEVANSRVAFEPLARLNPREQAIFRIQAQGLRAGDQRIQVQVTSDDSPTPVTKEESTRIYADR